MQRKGMVKLDWDENKEYDEYYVKVQHPKLDSEVKVYVNTER